MQLFVLQVCRESRRAWLSSKHGQQQMQTLKQLGNAGRMPAAAAAEGAKLAAEEAKQRVQQQASSSGQRKSFWYLALLSLHWNGLNVCLSSKRSSKLLETGMARADCGLQQKPSRDCSSSSSTTAADAEAAAMLEERASAAAAEAKQHLQQHSSTI